VAGLKAMQPVEGRLQTVIGIESSTIINDAYNANPTSVQAAIDMLAGFSGDRHLVLGDMAELGADADEWHTEMGRYAKRRGIDKLWTTGVLAEHSAKAFAGAQHFDSQAELLSALEKELTGASTVLVKGSRSSQMEVVVNALREPQTRDTSTVTIDLAEGLPS
jgi:UDP-N-acetylmuramoyl-tripeptide--D-alanyl-D-alanine ligase